MKAHHTLIIRGKVQGVFYRASARQKAEALNITGFAKNLPDGSVLIEAEGEQDSLEEFALWCKKGPSQAEVKEVTVNKKELTGYLSFTIKH